jgi:glucose/arabinose dehydrogenase
VGSIRAVVAVGACDGNPTATPLGTFPRSAVPPVTTAEPTPSMAWTPMPPEPSRSDPAADLATVRVRLTRVAYIANPIALAYGPTGEALYVAQRTGEVRLVRDGVVQRGPILDLSSEVLDRGGPTGLLGLAIAGDGSALYLTYTALDGAIRMVGFALDSGGVDQATRRELLRLPMPRVGEDSGGDITFGPDGHLWLGIGDGNFKDPLDLAQSLDSLFGKLLRIDPSPSGGRPYTIPADNPFVLTPGARSEIFAYGLRHPWRFSFDRTTGDL